MTSIGIDDPVWLTELREQCHRKGQANVAKLIGYSPAVVNQVLQGKNPGRVDKVERAVRGAFMGETCFCPVMGEIPADRCLAIQKQPFASTNPQRVKLYRACRDGCHYSQIERRES